VAPNPPRDAPPPAWAALRRPDGGKLVYLDQKHWVHLAQADTGHPGGTGYAAALQTARTARAAGTAVFPLSMVHYSETLKMTSVRHRSDLARLMEELSGFTALPARSLTALYELDAAVTAATGIPASALPPIDLLGRGFRWAQGIRAAGRLVTLDGGDGTGLLRTPSTVRPEPDCSLMAVSPSSSVSAPGSSSPGGCAISAWTRACPRAPCPQLQGGMRRRRAALSRPSKRPARPISARGAGCAARSGKCLTDRGFAGGRLDVHRMAQA